MKTYTITQEQMYRLHGAAHSGGLLGGQAAYEGCLKIEAILAEIAQENETAEVLTIWQQIETAPKNGTKIIAFSPRGAKGPVMDITWWRREEDRLGYVGWGEFNTLYWPPTHWMPLPAPPAPSEPPRVEP